LTFKYSNIAQFTALGASGRITEALATSEGVRNLRVGAEGRDVGVVYTRVEAPGGH
jgi:hypothetical protein